MKKRMFLALDISSADKVKVVQWRKQHLTLPFKAIDENNFHITLAFLGLLEQETQADLAALINQQHHLIQQQLKVLVAQDISFSLRLSKVGYFKKAQVLHLMPESCPQWLMYLNEVIVELSLNSNITLENYRYQPHLSVYRKAKSPLIETNNIIEKTAVNQTLSIKSFSLYHSFSSEYGVQYMPIQTWKL
jgi:2'-5' RNA ligase